MRTLNGTGSFRNIILNKHCMSSAHRIAMIQLCLFKGKRNAAFFEPYLYLKTSLAAQVNKAFSKNKLLGASARKQNFFSFPHFFSFQLQYLLPLSQLHF